MVRRGEQAAANSRSTLNAGSPNTEKENDMNTAVDNQRLMKTLDDAWNSQDCDTFNHRHAENVAV